MPRALVVFESMFGNTRAVAEAIADGLATFGDVRAVDVRDATTEVRDMDLIVVGAPTHAFGLSRPRTRADAGTQGADPKAAAGGGVREWIDSLDSGDRSPTVAVFDTRIHRPRVPGSAARAARRRLRRHGFRVGEAVSFWVTGTPGPLSDGELARARRWGEQLAAGCSSDEYAPGELTRARSTARRDVQRP